MHPTGNRIKVFLEEFGTFSSESAIKPLSFIHNAKFKGEAVTWFIMIAIFTCLTGWNVYETVEQYRKHETLTKIHLKTLKESNYIYPVLCVELPTISGNESVDISGSVMEELAGIPDLLEHLVNSSVHFDRLGHEKTDYASCDGIRNSLDVTSCFAFVAYFYGTKQAIVEKLVALLQVSRYVLSCAAEVESIRYFSGLEDVGNLTSLVDRAISRMTELDLYSRFNNDSSPMRLSLAKRLIEETHDKLDLLSQAIGSILCHQLVLLAGYYVHRDESAFTMTHLCSMKDQLWLGITPVNRMDQETDLWDTPGMGEVSGKRSVICVNVSLTSMLSFDAEKRKTAHVHITFNEDDDNAYFDLSGDVVKAATSASRLKFSVGEDTIVRFSTLGHYKAYRRNSDVSERSLGLGDCTVRCAINKTVTECCCWQSTISRTFQIPAESILPNCRLFPICTTAENGSLESFSDQMLSCQSRKCREIAEFKFVQADTVTVGHYSGSNRVPLRGGALTISPTNFIYPEFEEVLAMDARSFLSALGGSLSIYIGASFIAIVHIFVYIARSAYTHVFLPFAGKTLKAAKDDPYDRQPLDKIFELLESDTGQEKFDKLFARAYAKRHAVHAWKLHQNEIK